jgi:mono/diheme cytochrome c family protein
LRKIITLGGQVKRIQAVGSSPPLKIVLLTTVLTAAAAVFAQGPAAQKSRVRQPDLATGKDTFTKYCASCHGVSGKGDGPAAAAFKPPPMDLTALSKSHDGKFPASYVSAVLKFGRNVLAHGDVDMPVWGSRFKAIDPAGDPTGQHHVDDVVAYLASIQVK